MPSTEVTKPTLTSTARTGGLAPADIPVEAAVDEQIQQSVLRTAELFALTKRNATTAFEFAPSKKVRVHTKLDGLYLDLPESLLEERKLATTSMQGGEEDAAKTPSASVDTPAPVASIIAELSKDAEKLKRQKALAGESSGNGGSAVVEYTKSVANALAVSATGSAQFGTSAIVRRRPTQVPKPKWHAPWKLKRVISGHLGWVRAVAVDPTNDWFVTGSADRTIKVWDLASGQLKLTLTGHINTIRGLDVSARHPYLFSAAEDKKVLCWDLEYNKVIRSYHGHLSGVFALKLHPTLDILVTGGRDAVARVWDMRTKNQIHCLSGHEGTVWGLETQGTDPQVITGSSDSTVKLWDLAAGKVMTTLTNHKKGVRALTMSPTDHSFITGAADNLKKWDAKDGRFLRNFSGHNAIINSVAVNEDAVLVSCADNGSMRFWDYTSGYCFQQEVTKVQPGSLDSEAGIYASMFDHTGLRFITAEADKTIKIWHEDPEASEDTHPIDMAQWTKEFTAPRRY